MRSRLAISLCLAACCAAAAAPLDLSGAPDEPRIVVCTFFSELLSGLRAAAPDFEAETGIVLEVQAVPYLGYQMWLHARFLAKNPPEVLVLENPGLAWRYGQAGLMTCFDDLVAAPNPFAPEDGPWRDAFRKPHLLQSLDTNGRLYLIPYTQYGVGFFYNGKMYEACGLEAPETWEGLLRNLDVVKEAGYTAFLTAVKPDDAQTAWIASILTECLMRVHIPEVNLRTETPDWRFDWRDRECTVPERIDLSERIVAFERGIIDPARAPEFAEMAEIVKDMSRRWRPDFLSLSGEQIYKLFAGGATAHMMNGTWSIGEFGELQEVMREVAPEKAFDYGLFPFPRLTEETTQLARAGGINQNAGMRACVMVARQEAEPWREQAGIALVHYLTAPQVAKKVFAGSEVYDIPALEAVPPREEAQALLPQEQYAFLPLVSVSGYDAQGLSEFWTLWQGYLGGALGLEGFLEQLSVSHRGSLERQAEIYRNDLDEAFLREHLGVDTPWAAP